MPCQVEIEFMCDDCDTAETVYPGLSPHESVTPDAHIPDDWVVDDFIEDHFYCPECVTNQENTLD